MRKHLCLLVVALCVLGMASVAVARPIEQVREPRVAEKLRSAVKGQKVTIAGLPLGGAALDDLVLEPMEVWAANGRIVADYGNGDIRVSAPPKNRYFRGSVRGSADSAVFLTMKEDGSIEGLITAGERRYVMGTGIARVPRGDVKPKGEAPLLVAEIDAVDEMVDMPKWACGVENSNIFSAGLVAPGSHDKLTTTADSTNLTPETNAGVTATAYQFRIDVDTDVELLNGLGGDANLITYIGNLVGATAVIYQRDLGATLTLGNLYTYPGGTDSWDSTPTSDPNTAYGVETILNEFGLEYNTTLSARNNLSSAMMLVSGKPYSAGVAWTNLLCKNSTPNGNTYQGAYGFVGSLRSGQGTAVITTTIPNADATVNGVVYGVPANNNFWMLTAFAHELGHIANGPHSHCVALTAEDKALYGVTRNYVDECLSGECFVGTPAYPTELGSVMSYCHNIFYSGSFRASRYLMGKAGEASFKMLAYFLDKTTGGMATATPNATITTSAEPVACAAQTASVGTCTGCTYNWQVTGASINSGATTNSLNFTPSATTVELTVTITNTRGCGITATKTISATACSALTAPLNLVATGTGATTVALSWDAVAGATGYDIWRKSTLGGAFAPLGSSVTNSYNDTTATANTAYLYEVRATNGGGSSMFGIADFATAVSFTDSSLIAGTSIKALHITQLRTAVNALRTLAGLSAASFTDTLAATTQVKRVHITELRTALDEARAALSASALSYTDSTITSGTTKAKAIHITELRGGLQ